MSIVSTEIDKFYLSGGAGNTDIAASLGGAISQTEITSNSLHNLFDLVSSDEATSGDVEFKCFYVKNNNTTLTLSNAKVWINANIVGGEVFIDIGLGPSAINNVEQLISNESSIPSGVVFTKPTSKATGLDIGNIIPGGTKAIWVRRTVNADSSAVNNSSATIGFGGDTTL